LTVKPQNSGAHTALPAAFIDAEPALLESIFEKSGYAIVECEIIQKLCEIRDEQRLEAAVGNIVNYARAMAKSFRELQAVKATHTLVLS
jgi:hypothetical protein